MISPRQLEVLQILAEHNCECWGETWSHCDGWPGGALAFANFNRVADALARKGLVDDAGDRLEITDLGRKELEEAKPGIVKLNEQQVDMLQRVALAERFTSPPTSSKLSTDQRFKILDQLARLDLVTKPAGAPYRLTAAGRAELRARPWPYGDRCKP